MNINRGAMIDAVIPLVIPSAGTTRSDLARKLKVTYHEATRSLERLRQNRFVRRHINKSQYIYKLTGSRRSLTMGTLREIHLN